MKICVFVFLITAAVPVFGHSADSAPGANAAAADWCGGHAVPESKCTKCNPELQAKFEAAGDWCPEHGFPESVCPQCNPAAPPAAEVPDWCLEHALPESKCSKCNPQLEAPFKAAGDWCPEHGFPESVCPQCNPQAPPPGAERAATEARIVRFRSPELEAASGIETVAARPAETAPSVECAGRIEFDGDRVADIRAIVPGVVRSIGVELGERVEAGTALFELESTRVGEIQGSLQAARDELRAARSNVERLRGLRKNEIASARQVEVAEQELGAAQAEVAAAEAALRMAGAAKAQPSGRYTVTSPIAGTVVRRPVVLGVLATETTSLATIADTSVMWALCEVAEADLADIAVGQTARIEVGGSEPIVGQITWIAAEVDARTRTVTARMEVPNPDGRLRANQFARTHIETAAPRRALSVPRDAVQRVGKQEVVFIRTAPGVFQPRVVERRGDGEMVQIEGSVREGDPVVTTGAVLLRTEVTPGSIGAGCCETTVAVEH